MHRLRPYFVIATVVIGSVCITATAFAAFNPVNWQYMRDIEILALSGFVKIALPDTASKGGRDFSDIRIITQDGVETPYFITKDAVVHGGEVPGRILDQTVVSGATEFVIDTGAEGNIHTGMRLVTSAPDFRRKVSIYSSSSLLPVGASGWNIARQKGYIFKFTDPNTGFTSGKDVSISPAIRRAISRW